MLVPPVKDLFILPPYISLASIEVVHLGGRLTTKWIGHLTI